MPSLKHQPPHRTRPHAGGQNRARRLDPVSQASCVVSSSRNCGKRQHQEQIELQNLNRHYDSNQQYSITAISDGGGSVVERYAYSAYGQVTIADRSGSVISNSAIANRYTYTGREWDEGLNLYHYRARMYDAVGGRFVSRDPIGFNGSRFNTYWYVAGRALTFNDPSGLLDPLTGGGVIIVGTNIAGGSAAAGGTTVILTGGGLGVAGGSAAAGGTGTAIAIAGGGATTVTTTAVTTLAWPVIAVVGTTAGAAYGGQSYVKPWLDEQLLYWYPSDQPGIRPDPTYYPPGPKTDDKDDNKEEWSHYGECFKNTLDVPTWVTPDGGLSWDKAIPITFVSEIREKCKRICEYRCTGGGVSWRPPWDLVNGHIQGTTTISVSTATNCTVKELQPPWKK